MNCAKIHDLALEAAEAQKNAKEFEALAEKREREGRPLAAEAARSSAASWRRSEDALAKLIDAELNA